ncbi:MAG TPA: type III pantothenate kinase [Marinobacterium sp.]|nr:type III pantothenate kinase [Marinobacterium sp.]
MRLEIDLGNTLLKWRLVENEQRVDGGQFSLTNLEAWLAGMQSQLSSIWISSVAGDAINYQLAQRLQVHFGTTAEFARVTGSAAGLVNAYAQPERMGVDRWLAMLAAWSRFGTALLVVDAGSAITIERISADGHYLGGSILAGFQMQQNTLLGRTARVRFEPAPGDPIKGGVDTAACVASGAELVLRGLALQLEELARELGPDGAAATIVVTGGDALHLGEYLETDLPVEYLPELVMDGLKLAKRESV